jgi:hypothetical protein
MTSLLRLLVIVLGSPAAISFEVAIFDRFRITCPADISSIRHFEPSLTADYEPTEQDRHVWAAVYRSTNNKPSVIVKDEFLRAMRSATDSINPSPPPSDPSIQNAFSFIPLAANTPVAVARLRPSSDHSSYILDSMRCLLEKENTDESCDGGSEHTEAIATAIDALLLHYLKVVMDPTISLGFEGAIQAKATLTSAPLLEERGFREASQLTKEMVTHTSSLDLCLEKYAARSVDSGSSKSPGTRQRAMDIVSQLGRIDRTVDMERSLQTQMGNESGADGKDQNPWASPFF